MKLSITSLKFVGALELERQQRLQLEATNYSLRLNQKHFEALIRKEHKHSGDLDQIKRFIRHIPYLQSMTQVMAPRIVDKFLHQLQIRSYSKGEFTPPLFQIIIHGEVQVQDRSLVQSDTFQEVGHCMADTLVIYLSNEVYQDLLEEYHENLLTLKLETIKMFSVFNLISLNRLKNQLDQFKEEHFNIGTVLYKEGQPVDYIYLLLEGEVKLFAEMELQLCSGKSLFGELEMVQGKECRAHRATVTQKCKVFRIQATQMRYLLQLSNLYDLFVAQFKEKEKFWRSRKKYKKEIQIEVDFSEFKHEIPKQYTNFISVTKLRGKQKSADLDEELKEAKREKFQEAFKQFQQQIKYNFNSNYCLRRVLIQAKQANHNLPLMAGLRLDRFVTRNTFEHKKTRKILKQINVEETKDFVKYVSESRTTTATKQTRLQSAQSRLFSAKVTPQNRSRPQTGKIAVKRNIEVQVGEDLMMN